jgi:hypothetical protein
MRPPVVFTVLLTICAVMHTVNLVALLVTMLTGGPVTASWLWWTIVGASATLVLVIWSQVDRTRARARRRVG